MLLKIKMVNLLLYRPSKTLLMIFEIFQQIFMVHFIQFYDYRFLIQYLLMTLTLLNNLNILGLKIGLVAIIQLLGPS